MARRLSAGRHTGQGRPDVACSDCGRQINPLEVFPKGRCVDCHAASPEGQRMVSADELVEMWGGPVHRNASRRTESSKSAAFYDEDLDEDEYRAEMQALINSGTAWRMEGSVGRAAMSLIESGMCVLGEEGHRDYWGNYVPSRYEVEPGTKGSVEYAEEMGWTPIGGL